MSTAKTSDVFSTMLKIQLIATFSVALLALLVSGFNAGISAVLGGMSVVLGACAAAAVAKRGEKNT
ncbi:MAG: ATP synthase subunit I, partial [Methylotenera sp.]